MKTLRELAREKGLHIADVLNEQARSIAATHDLVFHEAAYILGPDQEVWCLEFRRSTKHLNILYTVYFHDLEQFHDVCHVNDKMRARLFSAGVGVVALSTH